MKFRIYFVGVEFWTPASTTPVQSMGYGVLELLESELRLRTGTTRDSAFRDLHCT